MTKQAFAEVKMLEPAISNGRNWGAGTLTVGVGPDDLRMTRRDREFATFRRNTFRKWISQRFAKLSPEGDPDTLWSLRGGVLIVTIGPHMASEVVMFPKEVEQPGEAV